MLPQRMFYCQENFVFNFSVVKSSTVAFMLVCHIQGGAYVGVLVHRVFSAALCY